MTAKFRLDGELRPDYGEFIGTLIALFRWFFVNVMVYGYCHVVGLLGKLVIFRVLMELVYG
jgi:hypothetical protein